MAFPPETNFFADDWPDDGVEPAAVLDLVARLHATFHTLWASLLWIAGVSALTTLWLWSIR